MEASRFIKLKLTAMTLWIIIGILVLLVLWIIAMYNGLIKARIKIDNSWSDINVFLKKKI